jgi:hypothetical protein
MTGNGNRLDGFKGKPHTAEAALGGPAKEITMSSLISRCLRTAFCAAATIALSDAAAQPSYPKYLVNGSGLALTRLYVEKQSGSGWVSTGNYENGKNYRMTLRLTNFYPPMASGGMATKCHITKLVDLSVDVHASAIFFPSSSFSGNGTGSTHSSGTDPYPLQNGQSRSYYAYYRWIGPPMPVSSYNHDVTLTGGEVCILPATKAPIRATP